MKELKQIKGITLVALIITIIVMLILAGITLNLTIGQDGIITRGQEAIEEHKKATAREKLELAVIEYEAYMREVTIESVVEKIEGFESITSKNNDGTFPYIVIIDGYEFELDEIGGKIVITDKGTANGIKPKIESIEVGEINTQDNTKTITVAASTEDSKGIQKIVLMKDGNIITEKVIEEANKKYVEDITFSVNQNGTYTIKVIGNNRREASEERTITGLNTITASLEKGSLIDAQIVLTLKAETEDESIKEVYIYEKNNSTPILSKEYTNQKEIEEQTTVEIAFYEEKTYYAKIVDNNNELNTVEVKILNESQIKTETDLKKLASVVKEEGVTFEEKTIKQVADITLQTTHIAIGTQTPFKGTYDGQEHRIDNIKISESSNDQGVFGYISNATIKNLVLGTGSISADCAVGGAVGYAEKSTIENIVNEAVTVKANTAYNYELIWASSQLGELYSESSTICGVGGICGVLVDSNIKSCINRATVRGINSGNAIGGIVGFGVSENNSMSIKESENFGQIYTGNKVGGIIGISYGDIIIENNVNNGIITAYQTSAGGIVGSIYDGNIITCENKATVTTDDVDVGGIAGDSVTTTFSNYVNIEGCKNSGIITSKGFTTPACYFDGVRYEIDGGFAGGIVGWAELTNITSCVNEAEGKIYATGNLGSSALCDGGIVGGIVGLFSNGLISKCSNKAEINNSNRSMQGGIAGFTLNMANINDCYNEGKITGNNYIGGIVGVGTQTNIQYCYNTKKIESAGVSTGGIVGEISPQEASSYTNNAINYCYNVGKIVGGNEDYTGDVMGFGGYCSVKYLYSLTNSYGSIVGGYYSIKDYGYQEILDEEELVETVLSKFGENFKSDYEGENSINNGYPILSWQ